MSGLSFWRKCFIRLLQIKSWKLRIQLICETCKEPAKAKQSLTMFIHPTTFMTPYKPRQQNWTRTRFNKWRPRSVAFWHHVIPNYLLRFCLGCDRQLVSAGVQYWPSWCSDSLENDDWLVSGLLLTVYIDKAIGQESGDWGRSYVGNEQTFVFTYWAQIYPPFEMHWDETNILRKWNAFKNEFRIRSCQLRCGGFREAAA